MLKILYASEEEKVEIDDEGNLKITPINAEEAGNDIEPEEGEDEEEKDNL